MVAAASSNRAAGSTIGTASAPCARARSAMCVRWSGDRGHSGSQRLPGPFSLAGVGLSDRLSRDFSGLRAAGRGDRVRIVKIKQETQLPQPVLTVRGDFGEGLAELVAEKLTVVARHAHHPVLAVHVDFVRHADPAVAEPVVARANIDLNGTVVHAEASAQTAQGAVNRLVDKLVRQLDDRPRRPRARQHTAQST